jgi:flagellar hook-length control protein FliK
MVESQVSAPAAQSSVAVQQPQVAAATGTTTATVQMVESQASTNAAVVEVLPSAVADPSLETGKSQNVVSAPQKPVSTSTDVNKKFDDLRVLAGNNPAVIETAALPISPVSSKAAPAAILSNPSIKSQPTTEGVVILSSETKISQSQQESSSTLAALASSSSPAIETVDSKVAGKWSTPQINTQAGEVVQQILRQMSANLQSGPTSMHLQLNPKELGAIDVQMIKNAQGVSVTFFAEQASTGRLLETQMDQLRQSLKDSGIQVTNLNISQHGQPGQHSGSFKQAPQFAQYGNRSTAQSETKAEIESRLRPERIAGQLQGIDYRI